MFVAWCARAIATLFFGFLSGVERIAAAAAATFASAVAEAVVVVGHGMEEGLRFVLELATTTPSTSCGTTTSASSATAIHRSVCLEANHRKNPHTQNPRKHSGFAGTR